MQRLQQMYGPGWTAIPLKRKYPEHPVSRQGAESDDIILTRYPPPAQPWGRVKIVPVAIVAVKFKSPINGAGIDPQFPEHIIMSLFQAPLHLHEIMYVTGRP